MIERDGYIGRITSVEGGVIHGRVANILDVVTFEGTTADELTAAFEESVEEYLAMCKQNGIEPRRSYSGRLLVRMPPDLHEKAHSLALKDEVSLNRLVVDAIKNRVSKGPR